MFKHLIICIILYLHTIYLFVISHAIFYEHKSTFIKEVDDISHPFLSVLFRATGSFEHVM